MKALILVDLQNDFMPGGALAVADQLRAVATARGELVAGARLIGPGIDQVVGADIVRGYGGDALVEELLTGLGWSRLSILLLVLATVFALGFVLDWMEIVLIVAPLVVPIVVDMGFDPVWADDEDTHLTLALLAALGFVVVAR